MRKILFVLLFLTLFSYANTNVIDECKVDLYYTTDIILPEDEKDSEKVWAKQVEKLLVKYPQLQEKIADTKVAYNISEGVISDYLVKIQENTYATIGWSAFKLFASKYLKKPGGVLTGGLERASLMIHDGTLQKQIDSYNQSIESGHGVVVVAHSTGNLFTEEVFRQFDEKGEGWKQNYFHTIAVASTQSDIINGGHGITFDNDIVFLEEIGANDSEDVVIQNPNRHDWGYKNALDEYIVHRDFWSSEYHKFEYYLGYPVMETTLITEEYNTVENKVRQTDIAKDIITQWLYDEVIAHDSRDSQWITDTESNKNTKDYKITVKHKFDSINLVVTEEVFPFNTNSDKKLYQAKDGESLKYVKASCGGKTIADSWEGQQENEYWKIDNPQEEKIKGEENLATINIISPYDGMVTRDINIYVRGTILNDMTSSIDRITVVNGIYRKTFVVNDGSFNRYVENYIRLSVGQNRLVMQGYNSNDMSKPLTPEKIVNVTRVSSGGGGRIDW